MMINKESIYQAVADKIKDTDFFIVEVSINQNNEILVEIDSINGVTIETCVQISKHISSTFETEIEEYELEVASASISQPFKVLKQYEKFIGNEVEVLSKKGLKSVGILKEANADNFTISITKKVKLPEAKRKQDITEDVVFAYDEIKYTKYIIRF